MDQLHRNTESIIQKTVCIVPGYASCCDIISSYTCIVYCYKSAQKRRSIARTTTLPRREEGAAKEGTRGGRGEMWCGVMPMDESSRGAARKQRRGKRGVNISAIQFEERRLKAAERAMNYMESRGSVDR